MDHETAIEIRAAERYCSGELTREERDQFEEHFFLCSECAEEVRWEQIFAANARAVLLEQERTEHSWRARARRWLSIFQVQPILTASALANAVLLLGVGYLALSVLPGLRRQVEQAYTPELSTLVAVPTAVRAHVEPLKVPRERKVIALSFALPRPYPRYAYQISREGGGIQISQTAAAPAAGDELLLTIPTAGLTSGSYVVVLRGVENEHSVEVGRYNFQME